jgi:transcription initiation factor IIE alpha subunit
MVYRTKKMSIWGAAHKEITDLEDSRVFFESATGHSCQNWAQRGVVNGAMTHGGTCDKCGRTVSTLMDDKAAESECVERRVEMVHAS